MISHFSYRTLLKYCYIPGVILLVAGLVAGLTTKTWSPVYISLLVAGSAILLVWLIYTFISAQGFWQRRSTQASTNAFVATLSLLAILGLINFLAVRYSTRIDLTENQLFTLSPQSQEIVRGLKQPVRVIVFDRDINYQDKELLKNYQRYSKKVEFEFIDPDLKPGVAKQFNAKSVGDIYLEYGDKKQLVQSIFTGNQREPISEIKLTNAIEKIQRDRNQNIYFLQGHGERSLDGSEEGMSEAVNSLEEKGYTVEPLNLAQSPAIPQNADVIVIAGPKRQLFPQEVAALKAYSEKGGNLLILLDPETNLGLEPLLEDWGVQLDERIVIDASGTGNLLGLGPTTPIIVKYGNHPIAEEFSNGISLYPLARPIATVNVDNIEAVPLLITSEQMWGESDLESPKIAFDPNKDMAGPFDLGVALTRKLPETAKEKDAESPENSQASPPPTSTTEPSPKAGETPAVKASPSATENNSDKVQAENMESRMVVVGNSTFATNGWFEQQLNGDVFLNSVQWLASSDSSPLSIRPKEAKNRRINLTPLQAGILAWLSLVIVPLFALVVAGITWWKRR